MPSWPNLNPNRPWRSRILLRRLAGHSTGRHHLVEIKRIEELTLSVFPPTHHAPLPLILVSSNGITVRELSQ